MKTSIYVCHTYYHVYISFLKELNKPLVEQGYATMVLSSLSIDFEELGSRILKTPVFQQVINFDEKRPEYFEALARYKVDTGNLIKNLWNRIQFTKRFARFLEPYIPVDFTEYDDIYVYCDSDPIGYYLNQNTIKYHAVEDGLNCLKNYDAARYDNRGHFGLKAFMSNQCNLIFIQNGYGKYCIDMEVNDKSVIKYNHSKYIEVSREKLVEHLSERDKEIILTAFIRDKERLEEQLKQSREMNDKILILTDPLCTLGIREQIFRDIICMYEKEGTVFLKPHPRDELDYRVLFHEYPQFDATLPMEILNYFPNLHFQKVVAVLTEINAIKFADEMVRLGEDFMDKYEDPLVHRQNEQI